MNGTKTALYTPIPARLLNIVATEFNEDGRAYDLFDEFFRRDHYSRDFSLRLIETARGAENASWDIRRLATLMLENQALKIFAEDTREFDFLFTQLNIKTGNGSRAKVKESVLKEGYSTTDLGGFINEFRQRLGRLGRVHANIKGRRSTVRAVRDFIHLSRTDCKLSLARYLFDPDEVVAEILKQVRVTRGVKDHDPNQDSSIENEANHARRQLPDFEARILEKLSNSSSVYWVSNATSSRINSLVEYPLTAVVLVVKPPGSNIEFELKRAGLRGNHALSVTFWGQDESVPPSHRLQGGSMRWLLRFESHSSARASIIYRLVHGIDPPVSRFMSRASIYAVPVENGEERLLSYFTRADKYGAGFSEMRAAMKDVVWAFRREDVGDISDLSGDLGLTLRFLNQTMPAQAIITGTSSFRLDRLAYYLSERGPKIYFNQGLKIDYTNDDARQLADEVLDEVLSVYTPPPDKYRNHKQYVEAALAVPENRARADKNYISVMQQIGRFWGTLIAVGGHSWGESFVARNVGLRTVWNNGQWEIKIVFMDHDHLLIGDKQARNYRANAALSAALVDERYIWGYFNGENFCNSDVDFLQRIYQVNRDVIDEAETATLKAIGDAYKKTKRELRMNPKLQHLFTRRFVDRLDDWDKIVAGYLIAKYNDGTLEIWKKETQELLERSGYKESAFETFKESIRRYEAFFIKYAFLYLP